MPKSEDYVLIIDISSKKIKIGLVTDLLKIESFLSFDLNIIDEDIDGFAKRFDMDEIWNNIKKGINTIIKKKQDSDNFNIIGISSCAQRMAVVFLDKQGEAIYGGPNTDVRGIDSAYLIEDEFSEEELFKITGHSPSILFCLARLLWFQEEDVDLYNKIDKVLMLDDWIVNRLTGEFYTDLTSAGESQLLDIKRGEWSLEIIEAFNLNPDLFPEFVESGTIVGELKPELTTYFKIKQKHIPVIKSGGDTQATLLGMGVIENANIGISLGTTAPVHIVVDKPTLDPNCNFWTTFHTIKGKWLVEGHSGNTGVVYDWLKEFTLFNENADKDKLIEDLIKEVKPGSNSTFAFLGPELMNFKDQATLKRGVFIFPQPTSIIKTVSNMKNFVRSAIENICFGINENFSELKKYTSFEIKTFCAGGMAKSHEFCQILTNILGQKLLTPQFKDSAFIGCTMNTLKGLDLYQNYKQIIDNLLKFEEFQIDKNTSNKYKKIFKEWKNIKKQVGKL